MLTARDIIFSFNGHPVLNGIDLHAHRGELLAVLGPNGVGKTTLLRCLNAMLPTTSGGVMVEGRDILGLPPAEIARILGYVPQRAESARLTVFDAVLLGRKPHMGWRAGERDLALTETVLGQTGLAPLAMRLVDSLSGGELQKVGIARALVQEPRVLLLDEPTSALDLRNQLEVLKTIREVVRTHGMAAILTLHDLNTALRCADRLLFVRGGRVYAQCEPDEVHSDIIQEVYGVRVKIVRHEGHTVIIPLEHQ